MSLSIAQRPTIVDLVFKPSLATDIALIAAGAGLTAVAAQLAIPASPVPFTFQTLVVLLVGASLGSKRGVLSLGLYALLGLAGLPVFAPKGDGSHVVGIDAFLGATSGFIFGFIAAAFVVGLLAERQWSSNVVKTFVAFATGSAVIYLIGIPVLANAAFAGSIVAAAQFMVPYMVWDVVKAVIAAGLLPGAWLAIKSLKK